MKIGPGKKLKNPMPPKEKERKERKVKEKASGARMEKVMARITFPTQLQKVQVLPLLNQKQLPRQLSSPCATFPVSLRSRERKRFKSVQDDVPQLLTEQVYMATPESETSYLTHALTPASMVLDLGCARAMTSWRAAKDLMEFCDQNPDCGLWYRLDQTVSTFSGRSSVESGACCSHLPTTLSVPLKVNKEMPVVKLF